MKYLKGYNESTKYGKSFNDMVDTVRDICVDIEDDGYNVRVSRESYWINDKMNVRSTNRRDLVNRFSASNRNDPSARKLSVIKVNIEKPRNPNGGYNWFYASKVKETFDRIVSYLGNNLLVDANVNRPLVVIDNDIYSTDISKIWDKKANRVEFSLHVNNV